MATKKILVVEDEEAILSVLDDNLTQNGFKVFKAIDGKEGLKMALQYHPDLILLDILMPVMDGITMLKLLRNDSWGKKAKVIILTNLNDNESVVNTMELGSYDYLVKSNWKIEDVIDMVKNKL
jgi:two-component system alkaline phosphatase synthesis response regulator PhoP